MQNSQNSNWNTLIAIFSPCPPTSCHVTSESNYWSSQKTPKPHLNLLISSPLVPPALHHLQHVTVQPKFITDSTRAIDKSGEGQGQDGADGVETGVVARHAKLNDVKCQTSQVGTTKQEG